ncbi:hypothetical protein FPOAC2_04603 [Fusarium poae]
MFRLESCLVVRLKVISSAINASLVSSPPQSVTLLGLLGWILYQPNTHIGLILCLRFNACVQHHLKHDTSLCTSSLSGIRCIEFNCYHLSFSVLSSLLSVHLLLLL